MNFAMQSKMVNWTFFFLIILENVYFYITDSLNIGDVSKFKSLIGEGANVSYQFTDQKTPLHFAACQGKH